MSTQTLHETTLKFLEEEPCVEGNDADTKVRTLLKSEYLRRLGRFRHIDRLMVNKYQMEFDDFVSRRVTRQKDFSWEVESDAMSWESAISGMKTMERKLRQLHEAGSVPYS